VWIYSKLSKLINEKRPNNQISIIETKKDKGFFDNILDSCIQFFESIIPAFERAFESISSAFESLFSNSSKNNSFKAQEIKLFY
jgi:hypothetical protein